MKKFLLNAFFGLFAIWFALLDRCLIVTAGLPFSGEIAFMLVLQASLFAFAVLLANGALPTMAEMAAGLSGRQKLLVFFPLLFTFLLSPALISDSMYRAQYGNFDKGVVHSHVAHDLGCCWNPF